MEETNESQVSKETEIPNKAEIKRDSEGKILPGSAPLNPSGRPKGKTLKEYWRERFLAMTDEEKVEFSNKVDPKMLWMMAEGNPHQTQDTKIELPNSLAGLFKDANKEEPKDNGVSSL